MKIAICISGFLRTWELTKKSFVEQLVKGIDYDLFIHTYKQNLYEFTAEEKDVNLTQEQILNLFSGLNLKAFIIEDREQLLPNLIKRASKYSKVSNYNLPQLESSDPNSKEIPIGVRTWDHLRKIHECNELRKQYEKTNNIKYDLVVKTRFDLVYFNSPNWQVCLDNKVHFQYGATFGWPDDTFCACVPDIMDRAYANRFMLFDEMYKDEDKSPIGICAHSTLKYILEKEKVEIGENIINTNCFRSKNSLQYYGNYKEKCDLFWLYDTIIATGLKNVYQIEAYKQYLLG